MLSFLGIVSMNAITFPLEMVRTRMQTIPELLRQKILDVKYGGIFDCAKRIMS
jgi:hypothetical protein